MPTIAEILESAKRHHQAGQFGQAEILYRQALQSAPSVIAVRLGLALNLKKQGKLDEAAATYQQILLQNSHDVEANNNLGNIFLAQNQLDLAAIRFQDALKIQPRHAQAHNNLGIVLKRLGRLDEAVACYRRALALEPDFDRAHSNLGNVLQEQGKLDQAMSSYRQALRCNPQLGPVYLNLGTLLRSQGNLEEATACARRAVQLQPQLAEGHVHLGAALQDAGRPEEAIAAYRQALRLKPQAAEPYFNLGGLFAGQNNVEEAVVCYREALRCQPDMAEAHIALGQVLGDREGKTDEAIACLEKAMRLQPTPRLRLALATCLPVIYQSAADVKTWRHRLTYEVQLLHDERVGVDVSVEPAVNAFYLAYQGLDDRDLQHLVASLHRPPSQASGQHTLDSGPRGADRKIRVGFVSSFFRKHTIGYLMGGLVQQLSREQFEVTVLSVGRHEDGVARFFRQHADCHMELPRHLATARRLIAERQLDVLLFTDVGLDPITSTLAFSRLAPVQCATWGHPVTTGIDTIDYFISSAALETPAAAEHYTETLVRLKTLPIYYYRPELPAQLQARQRFGVGENAHVYACPQSLFKLHPDFDVLLGGILRGDPEGVLLLSWGLAPNWEQLLQQRFAVTLPDVLGRIRFLPRLDRPDFLNLMALTDVLLDPLYFGGGNTSFEGLAVGTPIVTLPGQFLRGRITFALYDQMQMLDCVVHSSQEYVELALRLGTDADFRARMRKKILAANGVLYQNSEGVRELEQFWQRAVRDGGAP
jgi:protein O-GlcNAc transferase